MLIFIALVCSAMRCEAVGPDQSKNAAELTALCEFIKLTEADMSALSDEEIDTNDLTIMEALNMTLADPNWSKQFSDDASKPTDEPVPCKGKAATDPCKSHWKKWETAKVKAKDNNIRPDKLELEEVKLTSSYDRSAALQVASLVAAAEELKASWEHKHKAHVTGLKAAVITLLNKAAYNVDPVPAQSNHKCNVKVDTSRQKTCELPKAGEAICGALVCICAKGSTQSKDICGDSSTPNLSDWSSGNMKTHYATYDSICKKNKQIKLTAEAITKRLAALKRLYRDVGNAGGRAVILGTKTDDNTCKDHAGTACIDLTKATASTSEASATEIGWEQKLQEAVDKLNAAEQAKAHRDTTQRQITSMRRQVEAIFKQVAIAPAGTLTAATQPGIAPSQPSITTAGPRLCETFNGNESGCTGAECNYDQVKSECKPKAVEGTTGKARTGEATTEKCKGKPEKDCKDGCKWEGTECKDSSFLLKKQFAPIVSDFVDL
uniref:Variant surface glycoprotein 533 n=1 Tax=Trypanosoma brucei TaxID=5691 RepID=M4T093_9TRYP|nr:variant surface glycoprotein 533 [Trypanosoma brucei]